MTGLNGLKFMLNLLLDCFHVFLVYLNQNLYLGQTLTSRLKIKYCIYSNSQGIAIQGSEMILLRHFENFDKKDILMA